MTLNPIDRAAAVLLAAKAKEAEATQARLAAEQALVDLLPTLPEGSVAGSGEGHRVVVTYSLRRSVDEAALNAVRGQLPPALFARLFRFKPDVSLRDLRYVEANEPDLFAIAAQAITSKPGKPSVRVELVEQPCPAAA